jgi:formylglycine-generating enzyme required for sulfatase activity
LYTYPELVQLPGGASLSVTNKNDLFDKIPDLVQNMQNAIGASGGSGTSVTRTQSGRTTLVADGFVRVEGGSFQMGSASGGRDNERPVRTVTVSTFHMSKHQVTQREWFEVMGTTIQQQRDMANKEWSLRGVGDNYPMYYVSWHEVIEFCNRLSIREGLTPAYRGSGNNITFDRNANGYRLPTEAEWEFATKGGIKDYLVFEYSGSNSVDAVGWFNGNSGNSTKPVGTKAPNNLGLYDMSGNVWEWCWDWFGTYTSGSQTDPTGAVAGTSRVVRGGSWNTGAETLRSAYRHNNTPSDRYTVLGFRLVRS